DHHNMIREMAKSKQREKQMRLHSSEWWQQRRVLQLQKGHCERRIVEKLSPSMQHSEHSAEKAVTIRQQRGEQKLD
ncbi:Hypothetical predicted protein, partial [Xyrichtys novacula]